MVTETSIQALDHRRIATETAPELHSDRATVAGDDPTMMAFGAIALVWIVLLLVCFAL